jgi:hypothetical protein
MSGAPYGFEEYEARVVRLRRRHAVRRRSLALATTGLMVAAGVAPWLASPPEPRRRPATGAAPQVAAQAQTSVPVADQRWLALLLPEPAVVSVETRMAVVALEDRIAWIDDSLSESTSRGDVVARIRQLETERARLVDSLVRVRYAEQLAAASR